MDNLKGYYTYREVQQILGFRHRNQVLRLRDRLPYFKVGNAYAYNVERVNDYAASIGIDERVIKAWYKIAVEMRDINLSLYLPLADCAKETGFSKQWVHANSRGVRKKKFGRLTLYSIEDIRKELRR